MSQGMLLSLSAALVVLSITIAIVAWVSSVRWTRAYREALSRTTAAKDEAIEARDEQLKGREETVEALREEIGLLREMESVRFAERYLETKNGLEQRLFRLEARRDRWKTRVVELRKALADLELSKEKKAAELERLRAELAKTQVDARTLEEALEVVSTLGEIPVADLRNALARCRRQQADLSARIEMLALEGEGKTPEVERLTTEIEQALKEVELAEHEIEITRSAGPILDGLLGVTEEMKHRLAAVEDRLERSVRAIESAAGRDPVAKFVEAAAGATRTRNILTPATAAADAEPDTGRLDEADADGSGPAVSRAVGEDGEGDAEDATAAGAREPEPEAAVEARVVREAVAASGRGATDASTNEQPARER